MAKIQKVDLHLGQRIANQFKTSRSSSSNPFKFQDFEGNTLDPLLSADVLIKSTDKMNKLKMITSSVAGSITKIHSLIPESISAFVSRVAGKASSFWSYAKNKNYYFSDIPGVKAVSDTLKMDVKDIGKSISTSINDSISGIGKSLSGKMSILNTDVTDLGKIIGDKWNALLGDRISHNKITKNTTVSELEAMLREELALSSKEAA